MHDGPREACRQRQQLRLLVLFRHQASSPGSLFVALERLIEKHGFVLRLMRLTYRKIATEAD